MADEVEEAEVRSKVDFSERKDTITCGLCGMTFEPGEKGGCGGCPIRKDCGLICCPNCGYQMPKESKLVDWMKRRLNKQRRDNGGSE